MRASTRRYVMAAALGVGFLTLAGGALADPVVAPAPGPAPAPAAASGGTPISVRQTRPLDLPADAPTGFPAWKLAAVLFVGGLGAWAWKLRATRSPVMPSGQLRIVQRVSVGVRSELLLVDVDGQRLLLGVTPTAVQSLYIAGPTDEQDALPLDLLGAVRSEDVARRESTQPSISPPISPPVSPAVAPAALARLEARLKPVANAAGGARRASRPRTSDPVEEQARGIYAMAERK